MTEANTQTAPAAPANTSAGNVTGTSGLESRIAILLTWIFAPLSSIIFIAIEKSDKRVLFHAWQSLIFLIPALFAGWLLMFLLRTISFGYFIGGCISPLIWLIVYVVPVIAIIKAWNGEDWEIPVIGEIAKKQANK